MTMTLLTACKKSETNDSSVKSNKDVSTSGETKGSKYQTTYGSKVFDNVTITVELFDRSNVLKEAQLPITNG